MKPAPPKSVPAKVPAKGTSRGAPAAPTRTPRGKDRERLVRALAEYLLEAERAAEDLDALRSLP